MNTVVKANVMLQVCPKTDRVTVGSLSKEHKMDSAKAPHYCQVNAGNRRPRFVFSLTSMTGETDDCDSPFINTPAEEQASVQKKN